MDPTNYTGLTDQGVLGLGVLFFGSASVYLVVRLFNTYQKFTDTLVQLSIDQVTAQTAATRANEKLSDAFNSYTSAIKDNKGQ